MPTAEQKRRYADAKIAKRRAAGIGPRNPKKTPEERKAYHADWNRRDRLKDPEKQRIVAKKSRAKHKDSRAAENRAYERANPDKLKKFRLTTRYGLTIEQYDAMESAQAGVCLICQKPMPKPFIDHCHSTKKVRGLLCVRCNSGLGMFCDDPDTMRRAAAYVERHRD